MRGSQQQRGLKDKSLTLQSFTERPSKFKTGKRTIWAKSLASHVRGGETADTGDNPLAPRHAKKSTIIAILEIPSRVVFQPNLKREELR